MKGKKGLNIKALFTNHIEKIGFGLIALLVLGVWASEFLGGAWARTKENPNVMLQEIERKKREIDASTWPADMAEKFPKVDFQAQAVSLLKPIDSSKYDLSTTLFEPLNKPKEKAREPDWMTVEHLRADGGHVILALMPEEDFYEGGDEDDPRMIKQKKEQPEEKPEEEVDDELVRRDVAQGLDGDEFEGVMDEVPAILGGNAKGPRGGRQMLAAPGAQPTGGDALAGQMKAANAGSNRGGKNHRTTSGQGPKGMFYISVRGTFNLRQQLEKIQKALYLDTRMSAREFFQILDFELERQEASAGDDPWTKPWEPLNIRYAKEVLGEVDGFDDEPFEMEVFDPVITMPLPMRMFGLWKDHATHPNLKSFQISPEEQQKLNALRGRMLEEYEKMELQQQKARGPKRGGFADDVVDMRSMINTMQNADSRGMQTMLRDSLRNTTGVRGAVQGQGQIAIHKLFSEITPDGKMLLFRYFDFDVKPGYAYRYRVKLKLQNPNFERPVNEVVDRSVAEGEERWTDYSKASNAAVMPVSPAYFLKNVEKNPLADHGRRKGTIASVNIYEWHRELGTRVFDTLGLSSLGQFLGGKATTTILDVAEPSMEDDEYVFSTEDVLVDAVGDPDLNPLDHPDLKLKEPPRGMKTVALGLATEAMVVGHAGDLRQLEADGETAKEKLMRTAAEKERGPFKDLKKKEEEYEGVLDVLRGGDEEMPIIARGAKGKGAKGKNAKGGKGESAGQANSRLGGPAASTNPLRSRGRGAAAAAAGATMSPSMMQRGGARGGRRMGGGGGRRSD